MARRNRPVLYEMPRPKLKDDAARQRPTGPGGEAVRPAGQATDAPAQPEQPHTPLLHPWPSKPAPQPPAQPAQAPAQPAQPQPQRPTSSSATPPTASNAHAGWIPTPRVPSAPSRPAPAAAPATPSEGVPVVAGQLRVGGRQIAFGRMHLIVAGASLIVFLFLAYQLGARLSGPSNGESTATGSQSDDLLNQPLFGGGAEQSSSTTSENKPRTLPPTPSERELANTTPAPRPSESPKPAAVSVPEFRGEKDRYYILIQYFPNRSMDDAKDAAAFLIRNGVPVAIQDAKRDIRIVATDEFRLNDPDAATRGRAKQASDALKKRILDLGQQYIQGGGKYDFGGAQARKFPF